MEKTINYRSTIFACYLSNIIHASIINLTPILFIPLREQFGFTYSQFGLLILVNFITQVIVDVAFSKAVDKNGFRKFIVVAHMVSIIGFLLFVLTPFLFVGNEYVGFLIATVIFSGAGGFFELLLSPIVDALPSDEKSKSMALLHSFYAWGQVLVVVFTTLGVFLKVPWQLIISGWMVLPIINSFVFMKVPIIDKHHEKGKMKIRQLLGNQIFIIAFFAIACGAASELVMGQWMSSFMEKGLAIPKLVGDMIGLCGFAVMLGLGRLLFGIWGHKVDLHKVLIYGSLGATICYVVVALSPYNFLSIIACIISGICVSLLWPGTLTIASGKLPLAGVSLFALLAAGGDVGASVGPMITGVVADFTIKLAPSFANLSSEQFGLRAGILLAAIFPLMSMFLHIALRGKSKISIK